MGDMAEMYDFDYEIESDGSSAAEYFALGVEKLIELTSELEDSKVQSIRLQWKLHQRISLKQQWVLAYWIEEQI